MNERANRALIEFMKNGPGPGAREDSPKSEDKFSKLFGESNIPPRFSRCTFESISGSPAIMEVKESYNVARKYSNDWTSNKKAGKGILFLGHVGRMKTSLAVAIANAVMKDYGNTAYFVPMTELLDNLLVKSRRSNEEYVRYVEHINNVSLLILDDFGSEYPNDWIRNKVDAIITHRYNFMKPIIITSNLSVKDILDGYRARIFDRLRASSYLCIDRNENSLRRST